MGDSLPPSAHTLDVIRAWNLLANGMGAIDWSGLETVMALLELDDPDRLVQGLQIIKSHKPQSEEQS